MRTLVTTKSKLVNNLRGLIVLIPLVMTSHVRASSYLLEDTTVAPTFTIVESTIFSAHCTQCHSGKTPAGKIDLSTYSGVMASNAIIAGNAAKSPLYKEVANDLMPPKGPDLSSADIATIADWIDAGALNN